MSPSEPRRADPDHGFTAMILATIALLIAVLSAIVVTSVVTADPPVSERTACLDTMDGGPMP